MRLANIRATRIYRRIDELRREKHLFSLKTRLTLYIGAIVLTSMFISSGISRLLTWLLPVPERVPLYIPLSAFALVVSMVAAGFLSSVLFDPITELRRGMQKVAGGELDTRLETTSTSSEIRELFDGFNMMTKELASTEILQTDFVTNVSHEFKTPINAIEGYAMLLQSAESLDTAEEYADMILLSTRRLSSLVSNILLLSRIENQSIRPKAETYALDEQIREVIVSAEPAWAAKDIELDVELDDTRYTGSEAMLFHVWSNLLSNAVKFSPPCGVVRLRLRRVDERILFTIEDRGPGVSEEAIGHIFDKFYQEDTSHKGEGNGLGLALVKRILSIEGGAIRAENVPEGGCRFTVELPA